MERMHLDLSITGKVQNVWYRKSAVEEACRLGITGYAMNLPDGSVRIEAEGRCEDLDRFVDWCRRGPSKAQVEHVEVKEGLLAGFLDFATRH